MEKLTVKRVSKYGLIKQEILFNSPIDLDNCDETIKLNEFLDNWKDLPKQGTKEWFNNRLHKIGGSEIAAYLGLNQYKTKEQLLRDKKETIDNYNNEEKLREELLDTIKQELINIINVDNVLQEVLQLVQQIIANDKKKDQIILQIKQILLSTLDEVIVENIINILQTQFVNIPQPKVLDEPALRWGTMFEDCVRKFTEDLFNTKIYETGSIPYNIDNTFQFSPDGLGVVNTNGNKIALFEFKCPMKRQLKHYIPGYYIPQVKMGLSVLQDLVDLGLYCEFIIKPCTEKQYNTIGHLDDPESIECVCRCPKQLVIHRTYCACKKEKHMSCKGVIYIKYNNFDGIKVINSKKDFNTFIEYPKKYYTISNKDSYDLIVYYKIIEYNCFYVGKQNDWLEKKISN